MKNFADFSGTHLGTRTLRYDEGDAALYALAVGAAPSELELVYERDLKVLSSYAAALGIWATEEASRIGGYDQSNVLHLSQKVRMHAPMPAAAAFEASARVAEVFDKGRAALIHIVVECAYFDATYVMFVPDAGGWGGDRGPSATVVRTQQPTWEGKVGFAKNAAALYRLTGDPHPVHIDPELARSLGYQGPILQGLCTFGSVVREVSTQLGVDPTTITNIDASFLAPVYPGDLLTLRAEVGSDGAVMFEASSDGTPVLSGAFAAAGQPATDSGRSLATAAGRGM
jgi:acyl dehydratase